MRVVLDSNVLVAGVRSRQGASFSLLSLLPDPRFQIALSVALYTEWQDVMSRPEHWPPGSLMASSSSPLRRQGPVQPKGH